MYRYEIILYRSNEDQAFIAVPVRSKECAGNWTVGTWQWEQ